MKIKPTKGKSPVFIVFFIGIILISYTAARAAILSFTHDESLTYIWFLKYSFMGIVSYEFPSAGNHIMNTLAIKLFVSIFPTTDFFIRLPNVLAHLAYLIFSGLILKRFNSKIIFTFGFILLNFNPYMLDFFSLARGYGMSLAFMIASIWAFIRFIEGSKQKYLYLAYSLAAFAVLSNFVLLHFYVALILVANLSNTKQEKAFLKFNIPAFISTVSLGIILFEPIRKLIKFNEMYIGGNNGFYQDTVVSFINGIKYNQDYIPEFIKITAIVIIALIACLFAISLFQLTKQKVKFKASYPSIFLALLLFPVFSLNLQHYILGSNFITYRLTLFFFPLLCLAVISLFAYIMNSGLKIYASLVFILISGLFVYHTIRSANFTYASEWKYDANTKNAVFELEKIHALNPEDKKMKLGINWLFEPTINYYRISRKFDWMEPVTRDGINADYDYYYIFEEQVTELENPRILNKYKTSETILVTKAR